MTSKWFKLPSFCGKLSSYYFSSFLNLFSSLCIMVTGITYHKYAETHYLVTQLSMEIDTVVLFIFISNYFFGVKCQTIE